MSGPTITKTWHRYGEARAEVEPYIHTDKYGDEYQITDFSQDDPKEGYSNNPQAWGFKIKRNGEPANRRTSVRMPIPDNVKNALSEALDNSGHWYTR